MKEIIEDGSETDIQEETEETISEVSEEIAFQAYIWEQEEQDAKDFWYSQQTEDQGNEDQTQHTERDEETQPDSSR